MPATAGSAVYAAWVAERTDALARGALAMVAVSAVAVSVGIGALIAWKVGARALGRRDHVRGAAVALLLVVDIALLAGVGFHAISTTHSYRVEIRNESTRTLGDLRVTGPGVDAFPDAVPAGERAVVTFMPQAEGTVVLHHGPTDVLVVDDAIRVLAPQPIGVVTFTDGQRPIVTFR